MIKDRGNKKWNSLMLPEHVQLLRELWNDKKNEKTSAQQNDDELNKGEENICLDQSFNFRNRK